MFLRREKSALKRNGTPEFQERSPAFEFSLLTQSLPGVEQLSARALDAVNKVAKTIPVRARTKNLRMMAKGYGPIFAWTGSAPLSYPWLLANDLHLEIPPGAP